MLVSAKAPFYAGTLLQVSRNRDIISTYVSILAAQLGLYPVRGALRET